MVSYLFSFAISFFVVHIWLQQLKYAVTVKLHAPKYIQNPTTVGKGISKNEILERIMNAYEIYSDQYSNDTLSQQQNPNAKYIKENKIYVYWPASITKENVCSQKNAVVNFIPGILTNLFSLPLRKIMCVNLRAIREYCYIATGHEVQFTRPLKFGIYTAHSELKNQTNRTKQNKQ